MRSGAQKFLGFLGATNQKLLSLSVCAGSGGLLLLLVAIWWLTKVIKKRNDMKHKEKFFKWNGGFLLQQEVSSSDGSVEKTKLFNSEEFQKATDHYNEDHTTDHYNEDRILGLAKHIHEANEEFPLSWEMRVRIAIEVIGALSYLHYAASIPIYHRDIKSTNIMLDETHKANVSDFGTSRSVAVDQTHLTTLVQGTFGYLDPEYFQSSQFIDKSDVYSFGVVIVELLTGLKPISSTRSQESRSLVTHFMESIEENHLLEILDPQILKEDRREEMIDVAHLARRCLNLNGKKRPTMKDVSVELEGIRMSQGGPTIHQHYEEVEYNTTDLTEAWDVASTSTWTFLDSGSVCLCWISRIIVFTYCFLVAVQSNEEKK
ncbi:unnamed protein product [Camellia sinensis]